MLAVVAQVNGDSDLLAVAESDAIYRQEGGTTTGGTTPIAVKYANLSSAILAVARGDVASAERHYSAIASGPKFQSGLVCFDRILGLSAQTMTNLDRAAAHFEDALAFCRIGGYRPELAWTCCDYALRERDGPGDKEKAVSLLDESLAISSELGMRPFMERVLSRREILGA